MKNNERCIGVFDSGLGGLTVVDGLTDAMPNESIVYLGDTAHMPYGSKTEEQLTEYVFANMEFLMSFNVKAIVIACNTADSVVREKLTEAYDLPIFGVIAPAARQAVKATKNGKIGVIATNAAVNSGAYEREIHKLRSDISVKSVACPKLVPLIEQGHFSSGDPQAIKALEEYLLEIKKSGSDTLILGCTHYPLLSEMISGMLPGVKLISSSAAVANDVKAAFEEQGLASEKDRADGNRFFVTEDPSGFYKNAKLILGDRLDKIELA